MPIPAGQHFDLIGEWPEGTALDESLERKLQDAIEQLSQSTLRRTDHQASSRLPQQYRRTPVYIALAK